MGHVRLWKCDLFVIQRLFNFTTLQKNLHVHVNFAVETTCKLTDEGLVQTNMAATPSKDTGETIKLGIPADVLFQVALDTLKVLYCFLCHLEVILYLPLGLLYISTALLLTLKVVFKLLQKMHRHISKATNGLFHTVHK